MTPSPTFADLGVRPALVRALAERGVVTPFPIQAASLPDALAGRDVLGRGRTGSGKTVAFALPLLERLLSSGARRTPNRPRALVLVPTRELAVQVNETVEDLARAVRLVSMTVYGGVRYEGQVRRMNAGADVVVATPGRLEDLMEQGVVRLDRVEVVVLDEADLMADMGFLPPVTRILEAVPPGGQRMLFSATLDGDVQGLVDRFLEHPLVHSVDADDDDAPMPEHYLFGVDQDNKAEIVHELLMMGGRTLAFTRTRFAAERLAETLNQAGIAAVDLHGNLRQGARQRHLAQFADGTVTVLVATDIAARGIHVDDVGLVLHVDPPNDPKAFLHRSGRTARAGQEGRVVTLATRSQNKAVRALLAEAGITPVRLVVKPGDPIIAEVRAEPVVPDRRGASMFMPDPADVGRDEEPRGPAAPRVVRDGSRGPRRPAHGPRVAGVGPGGPVTAPRRRFGRSEGESAGGPAGTRTGYSRSDWGPEPWEVEDAPRPRNARERLASRRDRAEAAGSPRRRSDSGRQAERAPQRRDAGRPDDRRFGHRDGGGGGEHRAVGDRSTGRPGERSVRDGNAGRSGERSVRDRNAGRPGERSVRDRDAGRPGKASRSEGPEPRRDRERPAGTTQAGAGGRTRGSDGAPRTKERWTAEDRRRAEAARKLGFGYAAGGRGKKKAAPGSKDKGKPKRFR